MKENKKLIISGLVVIAFIAICSILVVGYSSPDSTLKEKNKTRYITIDDSGLTVLLNTGDTLVLTLKDYGDGGYSWDITTIDDSVLHLVNRVDDSGSGLLGDFGNDVWTFTVKKPGTITLGLDCKQPWTGGDTAYTATFNIVVK